MSRDDPLPTAGLYGPGHPLPREAANDVEVMGFTQPAVSKPVLHRLEACATGVLKPVLLAFFQEGRHRFRKCGGEALTTVLLKLGFEVQRGGW